MADEFTVVWKGVHEFERSIDEMNARVDRQNRVAVEKAGIAFAGVAAKIAPRGLTGALAGSIIATPVNGPLSASRTQVGPTIIYGRRNDIGFKGRKSPRGVRKRREAGLYTGRRGLQATKPSHFMEKALAAFTPEFEGLTLREWAKAIET